MPFLPEIKTTPKEATDAFRQGETILPFTLLDFWKWALSDLIENRNRGILAEFIVRQALGIDDDISRLEWNAYDLKTKEGITIEVKSAAYVQAWAQKSYSAINFGIGPSREMLRDGTLSDEIRRQADVYVFCLLHEKDQQKLNPMDMSQWLFCLVRTEMLNEKVKEQKSISISTLEYYGCAFIPYNELKQAFEELTHGMPR